MIYDLTEVMWYGMVWHVMIVISYEMIWWYGSGMMMNVISGMIILYGLVFYYMRRSQLICKPIPLLWNLTKSVNVCRQCASGPGQPWVRFMTDSWLDSFIINCTAITTTARTTTTMTTTRLYDSMNRVRWLNFCDSMTLWLMTPQHNSQTMTFTVTEVHSTAHNHIRSHKRHILCTQWSQGTAS